MHAMGGTRRSSGLIIVRQHRRPHNKHGGGWFSTRYINLLCTLRQSEHWGPCWAPLEGGGGNLAMVAKLSHAAGEDMAAQLMTASTAPVFLNMSAKPSPVFTSTYGGSGSCQEC